MDTLNPVPAPLTRPSTCEAIEGCTLPVDVILQSSDGMLLGSHSKNLHWFADGFPLSGSTTVNEIVPLTDKGDALLLFLKFTHNHPASDLSHLNIDELLDFAEVADKYCNYFALLACRQAMRVLTQESADKALKILRFKAIHHDLEGIDDIAARTMEFPTVHVLKFFGRDHTQECAIWIQYQQKWSEFITYYRQTIQAPMVFNCEGYHANGYCSKANSVTAKLKVVLEEEPVPSLRWFDSRFNGLVPCRQECKALQKWCERVRIVLRTAPTWHQFLPW